MQLQHRGKKQTPEPLQHNSTYEAFLLYEGICAVPAKEN